MDNILLTWPTFLLWIIFLVGLYSFLLLLSGILERAPFLGKWQGRFRQLIQFLLNVYEPVALIIITVSFVLVNPWVHGAIIGLLILLGYQPLKNYFSGRLFLLANEFREGQRIEVKNKYILL